VSYLAAAGRSIGSLEAAFVHVERAIVSYPIAYVTLSGFLCNNRLLEITSLYAERAIVSYPIFLCNALYADSHFTVCSTKLLEICKGNVKGDSSHIILDWSDKVNWGR
jgi:hypothetical protein